MSTENPSEPPILFPPVANANSQARQTAESFIDFESQLRACFDRGEIGIQTYDILLTSHRQTLKAHLNGESPVKPYPPAKPSIDLFPSNIYSANTSWNSVTASAQAAQAPTYHPSFEDTAWNKLRDALDEKTYGAPRVFDLFTLMAVTLAFGLLFALLKAMGSNEEVFICTTVFLTIVAICQMVLFGGDKPRLASLAGGPIALFAVLLGWGIWRQRFIDVLALLIFMPIPFGIPAGYLTGGVVAGVFLLADEFRKRYGTRIDESEPESCELDGVVPSTKQRL